MAVVKTTLRATRPLCRQYREVILFFFEAFPGKCVYYNGPHSSECVLNFWLQAGCLEDGWESPFNVSGRRNATWNSLNLRLVDFRPLSS